MKRPNIYTFRGHTITVQPGGQTVEVVAHDGKSSRTFKVIAADGAPSPTVQAQRWVMGLPDWTPPRETKPAVKSEHKEPLKPAEPKGNKRGE